MAHTLSSGFVGNAMPVQNRNSSGTAETRGGFVMLEINVSSYTSGGEVINAAELGLNKIYNAVGQMSAADTYAARSLEVATDGKSLTLNIDTAGTGTEVGAGTNTSKIAIIAWGELLGTGSN